MKIALSSKETIKANPKLLSLDIEIFREHLRGTFADIVSIKRKDDTLARRILKVYAMHDAAVGFQEGLVELLNLFLSVFGEDYQSF